MKNTEIITIFLSNSNYRNKNQKTKSLFFDDSILYSYGYHYPLCVKLADNKYIINNSGYSMTTSTHTNHLIRAIAGRTANLKEVEKTKQNYPNIILMNTEQIKRFIDYCKYTLKKETGFTSRDLALMELEKEGKETIGTNALIVNMKPN
jgi:hypothetical protein